MSSVLAFMGILLGMSASIMMQTVLATVLPKVAVHLGDAHLYGWVFSSYMIASTITLPIFARLADVYGRKYFYLLGMALFLVGSALSGSANSMGQLVSYRIVQGLGAGALAPAAIAMISDIFPIEKRGKIFGIMAFVQVVANVLGPILGGMISDYIGWRWAFYLNLPLGIFAMMLVIYGFSEPKTVRQRKKSSDITELINNINVKMSLGNTLLLGAIMSGSIAVLPLYGYALSSGISLDSGKTLVPLTIGLGLGGLVSGKFTERYTYAQIVRGGWLVVCAGFFILAMISKTITIFSLVVLVLFVIGQGLGVISPILLLTAQNAVEEDQRAVTGGLFQISRNIGGAIGIPIITGIMIFIGADITKAIDKDVFSIVFFILFFAALVGVILAKGFQGSAFRDKKLG